MADKHSKPPEPPNDNAKSIDRWDDEGGAPSGGQTRSSPSSAGHRTKLRPLKKIALDDGKGRKQKVTYQSEESYNAEIAQGTGYLLLDRKLIQIDDVPGPGTEL